MVRYRKLRDGTYAAFGPQSEIEIGPVAVKNRRGGFTTEEVYRISEPFERGGVPHVYGFLRARRPRRSHLIESMRRYS